MKKAVLVAVIMAVICMAVCFAESWIDSKTIAVGDIVTFGSYAQDNDRSNGTEPIEWIVLETAGGYQKHVLKPGQEPEAVFAVTEPVVAAYEYCNLHGLWKAEA